MYCIYLFLLIPIRPSQLVLSMWFYYLGPTGFLPWECLAGLLFVSLCLCLSRVFLSQARQGPAPECLASSPILNEWSLCPEPSPNEPDDAATQKFRGRHSSCENSGFPGGAWGKGACQCRRLRDAGLISGSGRSPAGGHGNPLSILVWRIPWTEEPGGLEFIGSQRVRHDWSDLARTHTCELWAMCRGIES